MTEGTIIQAQGLQRTILTMLLLAIVTVMKAQGTDTRDYQVLLPTDYTTLPRPSVKLRQTDLRYDSLIFNRNIDIKENPINTVANNINNIQFQSYSQDPPIPLTVPGHNLLEWQGGNLNVYSGRIALRNLMDMRSVTMTAYQRLGNVTLEADMTASRYEFYHYQRTRLSLGGSLQYRFSDNWMAVLFGHYVANPFYYNMAAMPFIDTSSYGAYLMWHNDRAGMKLGTRRYFDPLNRRWVTEPIVAPSFMVGKTRMEIDLGPLLKEVLKKSFHLGEYGHSTFPTGPIVPRMPNGAIRR